METDDCSDDDAAAAAEGLPNWFQVLLMVVVVRKGIKSGEICGQKSY